MVRARDPDRFLASLFAPAGTRNALLALAAFNAELAHAAGSGSQPIAGLMRLQWWRDTLRGLERGDVPAQPVAASLAQVLATHRLPLGLLQGLIDAREADTEPAPFADWPAFEAYADATAGALVRLQAQVLGAPDDHPAYGLAGRAMALIGHARAAPALARLGRRMLPDTPDAARARGAATLAAFRADWTPGLRRALPAVLSLAVHALALNGREPGRGRRIAAVALATLRGRV